MKGDLTVGMLYVGVHVVERIVPPGSTFNILGEFREHCLQVRLIKITRYDLHSVWMSLLMFAYGNVQLSELFSR